MRTTDLNLDVPLSTHRHENYRPEATSSMILFTHRPECYRYIRFYSET